MINRTSSLTGAATKVESSSNTQEVKNPSSEMEYFATTPTPETAEKSGYANQTEVNQGLPGYVHKRKSSYANQDYSLQKSGYSNQDALTGYQNTDASNQAQNIVSVANVVQSLAGLIISIKDKQTGNVKSAYKVCETLTLEEAEVIEQQFGVVLKKHATQPGRFDGLLGGGAFGRVYVARDEAAFTKQEGANSQGKYVAIKIIQGDQKALAESKHESGLQLKLTQAVSQDDSQLMPIIGIGENLNKAANEAEKLYIVMPLVGMGSGADLRKDLNELKKANNSPEFFRLLNLHIAKSMLIGLHQMHCNNIYHLDMKPANMMITGQGKIQLSDFGTSEKIEGAINNPPSLKVGKDQQSGRFIGNGDSSYFPPERTFDEGSIFNPAKADIYAAGAVLFEFLTGKEFDNYDSLNDPIFNNLSKGSLEELTLRLLNPQAASRISLKDALNHPCLTVAEAHDESLNKVVLSFLGNYVKYSQSKARGDVEAIDQLSQNLRDNLAQSQFQIQTSNTSQAEAATNPNDPFTLNPTIKVPFANRPDVQEQLQTYLPLKCSLGKIISDPEKQRVSLIDEANEFLANPDKAMLLLLADGGAGKSLFVQWLTTNILEQKPPYNEIKSPNGKPYFPLYVTLSNIKNPDKIFEEGLNLTQASIHELQQTHQVLLIMDGFDEQSYQWKNLYSENQLYNYAGLKVIVTSRVNALPSTYSEYFEALQQDGNDLGYQELYLQPFQADEIDIYVANYIAQHKETIKEQVEQKQLPLQWLEAKYVQEQINSISGLKELMQTPLLSRLVLIALPELNKQQSQTTSYKITRAQVYEAFMRQWIITQMRKNNSTNPKEITITDDKINQILAFGEKMALTMYRDNRSVQLTLGLQSFSFNSNTGKYQVNPSRYSWFEQGKLEQTLLPLQEVQKGAYKFVHLSMQEYLLARCLINELTQADTLVNLTLNQVTLTIEEKDRPILYFMGDLATVSKVVADKFFALINQTKTINSQGIAGANAISVLNVSEVSLSSQDFSRTYLPNADLSGSILWHSNFSNANLPNINLQGSKLNNSNFTKANVAGLRLGQYPMYCLEKSISVLCYSPDNLYLAIVQDKELILFDTFTRKEIRRFVGHIQDITSVSFSGDGRQVATGSIDKRARIYDAVSGDCLKVLEGHTKSIMGVSFSLDGKLLATGSDDKTARIYDAVSGYCLKVLEGHTKSIMSVSFSGDGRRVATGSSDETARIYDAVSGECLKVLEGHTKSVRSVNFSGDRKLVATGSYDGTARIYDAESGYCLNVMEDHTDSVVSVSFSRDSKLLATGSWDCTARIYDAVSGECLKILEDDAGVVKSVSFSLDGKRLATGSNDATARIYDVESGYCLKVLDGHTREIYRVSFSVDGAKLLTRDYSAAEKMWSVSSGEELKFNNTFTAWNGRSTRSLDNISVNHEEKTVNLKQTILLPDISQSETKLFRLSFPSYVRDVSLSKSITGNEVILTVVFQTGIACYSKALESPLSDFTAFRVSMTEQSLDAIGMNLSNTEGLSESNYEVLKQLGAVGEAANYSQPLESEPQTKNLTVTF